MSAKIAYIGLGANLGDRVKALETAVEKLRVLKSTRLRGVSSFYETSPIGVEGRHFLNAVAAIQTRLKPRELLDRLLAIESAMGRTRAPGNFGSRIIDLDLLIYGEEIVQEEGLELPHPRMLDRRFVLEPLAELEPDLRITSDGKTVFEAAAELREKHPEQEVRRLGKLPNAI